MATTGESAYRTLKVVLSTFLLFAVPIGIVSYLYVKQKTEYFNQRKFRQLAVQAERIRGPIENYTKNILPRLADAVGTDSARRYPNLTDDRPKLNPGALEFERIDILEGAGGKERRSTVTPFQVGQALWVNFDSWSPRVHVEARAKIWAESDTEAERLFDHLLLVDWHGRVIFAGEPAPKNLLANPARDDPEGRVPAVRAFDIVDLLIAAAGPRKQDDPDPRPAALAMLRNSGMRTVKLAGTGYELFVQPLQVSQCQSTAGVPAESATGASTGSECNWSIVGLTSVSRLRRESMTVSYTVVLIILFLFLLISLSWPFLKLWYQGPRERLGRVDVHFLVAHALLVTGLLTFFFADAYTYPRFQEALDDQLRALAEQVHEHLQKELDQALKAASELGEQIPAAAVEDGVWNPLYDRVAWVDEKGQQQKKWTSLEQNTAAINVKSRAYFKELAAGGGWRWSVGKKTIPFWLGPILSWTTGDQQTLLAVPWTANRSEGSIVTLVLRLLSLRDPVLPPSFSFGVIRGDGEVLFHSDRSHEIENLFVETDRSPALRAAVSGRAHDWMNASYLGQGYRLFVRPVQGLPWSIVAFRSKDLLRTTNLEILSSAFVMLLVYVVVALWPIAATLGWKADWCWPNARRNRDYLYLIAVYGLAIFLMFIIMRSGTPTSMLFTAVLVPPCCVWVAHRRLSGGEAGGVWRGRLAGLWLTAAAAIVLLVMRREGFEAWHAAPFLVLIVAAALGSTSWMDTRQDSTRWLTTRKRYLTTAVLLMVIAGILPAVSFFRIASRIETLIYIRHAQRGLADAFWGRTNRVNAEFRGDDAESTRASRLASNLDVYADFFFDTWIFKGPEAWAPLISEAATRTDNGACGVETSNLRSAYENIRLLYNDVAVQTQQLLHPKLGDCTLNWRRQQDVVALYLSPDNTEVLKSDMLDWQPPASLNWYLALTGGGLALLLIVVYLTRVIAERVVLIDLEEPSSPVKVAWSPQSVQQSTLLLGPPFSGKSASLGDDNVFPIDLRTVTDADGWAAKVRDAGFGGKRVIAIDHLDHRWDDPQTNRAVLTLVEQLITEARTVVIVSAVDPSRLEFPHTAGQVPSADRDRDRWARLLGSFKKVYVRAAGDPTGFSGEIKDQRTSLNDRGAGPAFRALLTECQPTAYLQSIGRTMSKELDMRNVSVSQIIDEVQDRAAAYYRALWTTCSRDERLALFDLAQDGFINSENPGIPSLLQRGLVVRGPELRALNESFRLFVLDAGTSEEIGKWEEANAPNRWNAVRWPVLAAVAFGGFLLFVSHREMFDTGVLFVGALGGGVAGIFKLLEVFKTTRTTT